VGEINNWSEGLGRSGINVYSGSNGIGNRLDIGAIEVPDLSGRPVITYSGVDQTGQKKVINLLFQKIQNMPMGNLDGEASLGADRFQSFVNQALVRFI
jgi:hypothetical protein